MDSLNFEDLIDWIKLSAYDNPLHEDYIMKSIRVFLLKNGFNTDDAGKAFGILIKLEILSSENDWLWKIA